MGRCCAGAQCWWASGEELCYVQSAILGRRDGGVPCVSLRSTKGVAGAPPVAEGALRALRDRGPRPAVPPRAAPVRRATRRRFPPSRAREAAGSKRARRADLLPRSAPGTAPGWAEIHRPGALCGA